MKLQNRYANAPSIFIIIKHISIKFSVTYDILTVSFKGIYKVFPNQIQNSKKQVFLNSKEVRGAICL
jgi:hypothetical protein